MKTGSWFKKKIRKTTKHIIHDAIDTPVYSSLQLNEKCLSSIFNEAPDFTIHHLMILQDTKAALIYLNSLIDKNIIHQNILRPLIYDITSPDQIWDATAILSHTTCTTSWEEIEVAILEGNSILFVDGAEKALIISTQGWPKRTVEEPKAETMLKGGHEGFLETDTQNIALIRRFIPSRELKIKQYRVGERGSIKVHVLYLRDVAHPEVLEELENRIQQIDVDTILTAGELEQYIEDNTFTPFPQFILTERPDVTALHILQGRIGVIVDRSPRALITPVNFISFFQTIDDYNVRWLLAFFIRLLRITGFFIAVFLPSIYIAIISFHYEVIPMDLVLSIGESRERVPFSPILEATLMELTLEMLREAGVRLPAAIGQTVSIVGGIVIGQAAVQAGLASNIMVIIVSLTAIASFIVPVFDMAYAIRLLRFPMMILAWLFGMVGIAMGMMVIIGHLISMETMGTPYGTPLAPLRWSDWKDSVIRAPLRYIDKRQVGARPTQRQKQRRNSPDKE
ncbi:spore germination protein [Aneurinibacillus sp. BA2021]|nr:spore germination protein [Aneurinibacillus sp. BA2021]